MLPKFKMVMLLLVKKRQILILISLRDKQDLLLLSFDEHLCQKSWWPVPKSELLLTNHEINILILILIKLIIKVMTY